MPGVCSRVKANYDRMELTVPQGRKAEIKAHADAVGESMNQFAVCAINETMEQDARRLEQEYSLAVN